MNRIGPTAETPSSTTGLFATLRVHLPAKGTRARSRRALLTLLTVCATFAVAAAPALAVKAHGFSSSFNGAPGTALNHPWGINVDGPAGVLFVADSSNNEVAKFDLSGAPQSFSALSSSELKGAGAPEEFAETPFVRDAPGGGDLYVSEYTQNVVDAFTPAGTYVGQLTGAGSPAGSFSTPFAVAVTSSGDVWVIDTGNDVVDEYEPEEGGKKFKYLTQIEASALAEPLTGLQDVAVDSEGNVYLAGNNAGAGHFQVDEFNALGEFQFVLDPTGGTSVAVDTSTIPNTVYALEDGGKHIASFQSTSFSGVPLEVFGSPEEHELQDIGVDSTTHTVYATDYNNGVVDVFPEGEPPKEAPQTQPASGETPFAATLHGELYPHGATGALEYQFAYNKGASCTGGQRVPVPAAKVANAKEAAVEEPVSGLEPSTKYSYCLLALNPFGVLQGNEVTFETKPAPPEIVPGSETTALPVKATAATLEAKINPENQKTTYSFEYSTTETAGALTGTIVNVPSTPGTLAAAFNPAGEPVTAPTEPLTQGTTYYYRVVAENANGEKATPGEVERFTTAIAPETPSGLEAKPIAATTATLDGILNAGKAGNPGTYEFFYEQSASECQGANQKVVSGAATGVTPEPVEAKLTGLLVHTQYTFCLRATNEVGEETLSPPVTFTTLAAPPTIEAPSTTEVASTSATLNATVNPQGAATTYTFEYAPTGGTFAPVPESEGKGVLPEGHEGVPLSVNMQHGLTPGASYEFRLVASNSVEAVTSEPVTFTTQTSGAFALPDGRQWELVTPPDKHGALFFGYQGSFEKVIKASVSGNAIVDEASQPSEAEPRGFANTVSVLSTRAHSGGWSSQTLTPPHADKATGPNVGNGLEYNAFSADLSLGVVDPYGSLFAALAPQASEATPYLRADYLGGDVSTHCEGEASATSTDSCYTPLVTRADDTTVPFQPFGEEQENGYCAKQVCGPQFAVGTPDLSHVILQSQEALTANAVKLERGFNYYEWSGGQLQLLPGTVAGASNKYSRTGPVGHALSADGSRVILEAEAGGARRLYLRNTNPLGSGDPHAQTTVEIGVGEFETASAGESRIFFRNASRGTSGDLYEYDAETNHATPLTENAGVAQVLGASADGAYVYFAANGNAAPGTCNAGFVSGACNVYVRHAGVTTLIAAAIESRYIRAGVSPNGRYLSFLSNGDLTGYDTRDASSGRPDLEVYLYDAVTGKLACASCNPTGARPAGHEYPEQGPGALQIVGAPTNVGVAASVAPETFFTNLSNGQALYQPRSLSDSGRLFFDSDDALVPHDTNGTQDVYEYEPAGMPSGVHACSPSSTSGSEVYKPAHVFDMAGSKGEEPAGCVALISSGTSPEESAFLEASEGGGDVFILTSSQLSSTNNGGGFNVYDAHECTSGFPCPPPSATEAPPCVTETSCKPSPTPQPLIYAPSGSATFSGPGNLTPDIAPPPNKVTTKTVTCKKGFVKKKVKSKRVCVKKPKSKLKAKKSAHIHRRTK